MPARAKLEDMFGRHPPRQLRHRTLIASARAKVEDMLAVILRASFAIGP
jgi:hypothetical protein